MKKNNWCFGSNIYVLPLVVFVIFTNICVAEEMPPSPVHVAKATMKDVPVTMTGTGHVEAYTSIKVKSRINGKLERVYVEDGAFVNKGDLLFEIDTAPYLLEVSRAEANLRKETTTANEAKKLANISNKLFKNEVIAKEKNEQQQAAAEEAKAMVEVASSALATANQNLEYCKITAQINGMVGRKKLYAGSLITAYQDELILLNDIDKLKAVFTLPADRLKRIQKYQVKGALEVTISAKQDKDSTLTGKVNYIGNEIDPNTGMFEVQGVFDNKEHKFWPGEYIHATAVLTIRKNSVLIPERALVNSEGQSKIVYIVDIKNTVEARPVKVGWRVGDDVVILEGVKEGETVVTGGLFKIYPGASVAIVPDKSNIETKK